MTTAALLVTHDSEAFIASTLASVLGQTQQPDCIIVIDDASCDGTLAAVREATAGAGMPVVVQGATTQAADVLSRIAQNFQQGVGVAQAQGADVVVLGDHDDLWHPDRIERQARLLAEHPQASMVASDGRLLRDGVATDETLRGTFPVPGEFNAWRASRQFGYAVRHSVATGGASAIRPHGFQHLDVPRGWLHDRWWSLAAAAHRALLIDDATVIDYRISSGQQVGLEVAAQGSGTVGRIVHATRHLGRSTRRSIDLAPLFLASR